MTTRLGPLSHGTFAFRAHPVVPTSDGELPLRGGCGPSKALCCAELNFRFRCYRNPINEEFIVNLMGSITVVVANSNGPIWPA